jgi:predicted RNase H-like HicB family nuclease
MVYRIVVHPGPSGGYWGEVPLLPGCYSQGETRAELGANLREAIHGYLEVLRSEGRSLDPEVEVLELAV